MAIQTVDPAPPADEPPAPDLPEDDLPTTATRYLSVGAYVDSHFRNRCLRDVYHQRRRPVAPSYGFDLGTVLWHCLRARRLTIWRDASIILVVGLVAYLDWRALVAVGAAMIGMGMTSPAMHVAGTCYRRGHLIEDGEAAWRTRLAVAKLILWAAAWLTLAVLTARILSSAPRPIADLPHPGIVGAAIPAVVLLFALPCFFSLWRQKRIRNFASDRPMPAAGDNARLRDINSQRTANTVIYSNFEPFIGSGDVISTWGFATRLVRKPHDATGVTGSDEGRREFANPPFTAEEIVSYVRFHLGRLTAGDAETTIPNLTVDDRIFLSAGEHGVRDLITGPDRIAEIIRNPTQPARHYLVCQVLAWGGEVVTTVHVHLAVQGRSLYLEVTTTSMAPCNERYRIVDLEGGRGPRAWVRAIGSGIRETPGTIAAAPVHLIRTLADMAGPRQRSRRRRRRLADRGAMVSVRQLGTEDELRNFTQRKDVLKFRRLIEIRVYAHVLDFLDACDVDTTEYRARGASVLNVGVINNGESVINGDVAGTSNQTEKAES
ncbi:hypothetical protein [Paractinoplanes durhamensis]|uniref:Uncharacterized protein n=1 Tax=Paractinoplanes durhamensis TaxID=113563 RepID=A0ABQ3ZB36_9ACTN|nr:hypothetical protein [Actinoplanes durhamensis]GIE07039.1 hypothetical protein Adu01nite_83890 [Actinoplanes durhamensis]